MEVRTRVSPIEALQRVEREASRARPGRPVPDLQGLALAIDPARGDLLGALHCQRLGGNCQPAVHQHTAARCAEGAQVDLNARVSE